ncbi:MAG: DUF59 domain-containing protein [Azospirillaceae bacterium]|nr:DUF59 domain-containing protein [Azospirillaceae bacterium]
MHSADDGRGCDDFGADTTLVEPGAVSRAGSTGSDDLSAIADKRVLEQDVIEAMKTVHDPEIPVNLVDLGLIYDLTISPEGRVDIAMTLTTPACPVAGSLPEQVRHIVSMVPGVSVVLVTLVWDPPWTRDRMSEVAQLELGFL